MTIPTTKTVVPTLVKWKFVPTTRYDIARWYKLLLLKNEAFSGDCESTAKLAPRYFVTRADASAMGIGKCSVGVFAIDAFAIFELGVVRIKEVSD